MSNVHVITTVVADVNNASTGAYAKIVQSADYRAAKMQTAASMLPDLLRPEATPLDLCFTLPSGQEVSSAQLLLVRNNPYQLERLGGGGTRECLDVIAKPTVIALWRTVLGRLVST